MLARMLGECGDRGVGPRAESSRSARRDRPCGGSPRGRALRRRESPRPPGKAASATAPSRRPTKYVASATTRAGTTRRRSPREGLPEPATALRSAGAICVAPTPLPSAAIVPASTGDHGRNGPGAAADRRPSPAVAQASQPTSVRKATTNTTIVTIAATTPANFLIGPASSYLRLAASVFRSVHATSRSAQSNSNASR